MTSPRPQRDPFWCSLHLIDVPACGLFKKSYFELHATVPLPNVRYHGGVAMWR